MGYHEPMQTFLPYPNFAISAMVLDTPRLGKQRVETRQIQRALQEGGGWANHPATRMWEGHLEALMAYGDCMIREWVRRGYVNNMPLMLTRDYHDDTRLDYELPDWVGEERFHASHRSNLLRKQPEHYGQYNWKEPHDLEYVWPRGVS